MANKISAVVKVDGKVVFEGLFADARPVYERLMDALASQDVSVIFDVYPTVNWLEERTIAKAKIAAYHDAIYEAKIHGATPDVIDALYALLKKGYADHLPYEYMDETQARIDFQQAEQQLRLE